MNFYSRKITLNDLDFWNRPQYIIPVEKMQKGSRVKENKIWSWLFYVIFTFDDFDLVFLLPQFVLRWISDQNLGQVIFLTFFQNQWISQ